MLTMHVKGDSFNLVTHVRVGQRGRGKKKACEEGRGAGGRQESCGCVEGEWKNQTQPRRFLPAVFGPGPRDPDNPESIEPAFLSRE